VGDVGALLAVGVGANGQRERPHKIRVFGDLLAMLAIYL
jgi:hypothetical protein